MSDPWAKFRAAPAAPAVHDAAQPGPPEPAPPAGDPWAKFRAAPAGGVAPDQPRDAATVQAEYDAMPWYAQAGQAADDIVRKIANGATFGYADKIAGALPGGAGSTEAERAKTAEAGMRAGSAGTVAEIGGAITPAVGLAKAGLSLPMLASEVPGVVGAGARTALSAVEGAGYGALDATGHDRSVSDGMLLGAIFGGAGNVAGEALTGGVNKVAGVFNKKPVVPTREDILAQAKAAYDAADNSGVMYTPQGIDRLKANSTQMLADAGYHPKNEEGIAAFLSAIDDVAGQNVTFKGLDTLRKVAGNSYRMGNDSNNRLTGKIVGAIDDFVSNPQAGEFIGGNAQNAGDVIATARDLWSRLAKGETIGEAVKRGEANAAASGTGWNTENALRQSLKSVYNDEAATRGFTPDETDALKRAVFGTPDQDALRLVGRLAPTGVISGGIGVGGGAAVGNAIAGPAGAQIGAMAVPAIGFGARTAGTRMETDAINRLADIIFAGGKAVDAVAQPNAVQNAVTANRDDLLRAIFGGAQQQAGEANARMRSQQPAPTPVKGPYREAKNGR